VKAIAIIPARGGSKRIPGKNIRDFCGQPIIAYSINAAVQSGLFEEVMVSTDDERIAGIGKECGAQVPFLRSEENSDDSVSITAVCMEVLKRYKNLGKDYDAVCCILPTAPFISAEKIIAARKILDKGGYDAVFPVVEYSYPIQRSLKVEGGFIRMCWPENFPKRSQDLEKTYHDAGQFYFIKTEALLTEKRIFVKRSGAIFLTDLDVQDIDTEADWKLAEIKYKMISGERNA
jgi:N-acylneuraminate cytidylyltransferase